MSATTTPGSGPRLSVIVPAYEEADTLPTSVPVITSAVRSTNSSFELIVIDDGSSDATWEALQKLRQDIPELIALRLARHFGKESAIGAGLDLARGDACIVLDADLQHPPQLIPEMVRLWLTNEWDVVEAIKSHRGRESTLQRAITRTFYRLARSFTAFDLQDASDFKLLDRRVVQEWRRFGERATFFRGLIAWMGFRRTQVAFDVPPRQTGSSRWSLSGLSGLAIHAVTSFSALPLQLVTVLGVLTLLIAAGIGMQALRLWYAGRAFPGFTTVILLQLIIGGFLMVSLGIIGTYIARIYDEVKGRPRYVIREVSGRD